MVIIKYVTGKTPPATTTGIRDKKGWVRGVCHGEGEGEGHARKEGARRRGEDEGVYQGKAPRGISRRR